MGVDSGQVSHELVALFTTGLSTGQISHILLTEFQRGLSFGHILMQLPVYSHGFIGTRLTHSLVYWSNLYPFWQVQTLSPNEKTESTGHAKQVLLNLFANGILMGHVVMLNFVVSENTKSLYWSSVMFPYAQFGAFKLSLKSLSFKSTNPVAPYCVIILGTLLQLPFM